MTCDDSKNVKNVNNLSQMPNITLMRADFFIFYFTDAILSAPGSGRHIERTTMFLSRLQIGALNLIQMKAISKYMLDMVDSAEQQNRILK